MPQDKPDTDLPAEAPPQRSTGLRLGGGFDAQPIFRVVEVVRDERGRLRQEGKIWHTDLGRMRKFGRALAANTASHRVVVADAAGNVLEEIPVAPADEREVKWSNWQAIPLPPLPPRKRPAPPKRKPRAAAPSPPPALASTPAAPAPSQPAPAALGLEAAVPEPPATDAAPAQDAPQVGSQTDLTLP